MRSFERNDQIFSESANRNFAKAMIPGSIDESRELRELLKQADAKIKKLEGTIEAMLNGYCEGV